MPKSLDTGGYLEIILLPTFRSEMDQFVQMGYLLSYFLDMKGTLSA
ncbi:4798_t:CDS:1, partial [Racocetra persica]